MAGTLAQLRELTDAEVVKAYDRQAQSTPVGLQHWADELNRRHQERQTDSILRLTKWITGMTIVITVATLVNVGIAICMLVIMMRQQLDAPM